MTRIEERGRTLKRPSIPMTIQPILAGRYQIEELLGQGGMAQVYRATDQVLQREVAVKVLAAWLASDPLYVTKFRREAQAAAGLNHPGIVRVFDSGTEGDTHYIVMERVLGSTLQQVMTTQGTLPLDRIVEIACSVAEALSYAHGNGLVHRDVKPGNIMIDDAGGVRISDFGIARTASQTLTLTGTVLGTATYISPEQARGEPADPRSDLYALGVVLYEMLAGRPPFAADNPMALAYKHIWEQPTPLDRIAPAVPPVLSAVVMHALEKDPDHRPQTAEDLRKELAGAGAADTEQIQPAATVADTEPLLARATAAAPRPAAPPGTTSGSPPPKLTEAPRAGRRSRTSPLIALAAVGVVAVFLLFQALIGEPGTQPQGGPDGRAAPSLSPSAAAPPSVAVDQPLDPTTVEGAAAELRAVVGQGLDAGEVDEDVAEEVDHRVEQAIEELQDQDVEKALERLDQLDEKIDDFADDGKIANDERADLIREAVDALRAAIESQGPPEGEGD